MYAAVIIFYAALRTLADAKSLCGIRDQRSRLYCGFSMQMLMQFHTGAIVGYNLYFTSGNYTFDDGLPYHNTSLLYILPLDKPVDVSGSIPLDELQVIPLPSLELDGGVSPETGGAAGTLFYNHETLYAYGGIIGGNENGTQNGLWTFNITKEEWGLTIVEGGDLSFGDDTEGVWADDPARSLSFYTGGWKMAYDNQKNGLVIFDSSEPDAPKWNFVTAQPGDVQGPDILKGGMVFVRKGEAGILVALGGFNTMEKGTEFAPPWEWDYRPMDQIFVYDIFSNTWSIVYATGDVPDYRGEFAIGVSSAPDDSSFQITIFGGYDLLIGKALDEVYVLTLPGFVWIKVDAGNSSQGYNRTRVKGDMYEDAQFMISGGVLSKTNSGDNLNTCDPTVPPIMVLNTTSYTWQTQFEPNAVAYAVSDIVTAIIGGDSSGGATMQAPRNGWNGTGLAEVFSHTVPQDSYVYPNGSNATSPGQGSGTDTGAIAGGVVGGVGGLAIVGALVWVCLRRKRQSQRQGQGQVDQPQELDGRAAKSELFSKPGAAQLETKTDRAELDEQRHASELPAAVQDVQSPAELEDHQSLLRSRAQVDE